MVYEVDIQVRVLVRIEKGVEEQVEKLVRDHVLHDWFVRTREGVTPKAGHYVLKGMSSEITSIKAFSANRAASTFESNRKTEEEIEW